MELLDLTAKHPQEIEALANSFREYYDSILADPVLNR